jgi:hypothetical protein
MNKIKAFGLVIAFFFSLQCFAQTEYVILWDVTWSMKGTVGFKPNGDTIYNANKDIWDETKLLLKDVIREIPLNGQSNVKIIPFQNPARKEYTPVVRKTLNMSEQQELLDFVDQFDNGHFSEAKGTNICKAISDVYAGMTDQNNTTLLIFSDGEQSLGTSYSQDCLKDMKSKFCDWCNLTERKKMYIYELKTLNTATGRLDEPCECVITTYPTDCKMTIFSTLTPVNPNRLLSYENAHELVVSFNNQTQLPPVDFKIRVSSSNNRINILNQDYIYSNQSITIPLSDLDIEEGNTESTTLSFEGLTGEPCYSFTISPVKLSVIREELSKLNIKEIIVK